MEVEKLLFFFFFLNLKTHICLVNPGGFQKQCYPDSFSSEKYPRSHVSIALLEEFEPWEAVETKGENHGVTCILPQ